MLSFDIHDHGFVISGSMFTSCHLGTTGYMNWWNSFRPEYKRAISWRMDNMVSFIQ